MTARFLLPSAFWLAHHLLWCLSVPRSHLLLRLNRHYCLSHHQSGPLPHSFRYGNIHAFLSFSRLFIYLPTPGRQLWISLFQLKLIVWWFDISYVSPFLHCHGLHHCWLIKILGSRTTFLCIKTGKLEWAVYPIWLLHHTLFVAEGVKLSFRR